MRFEQLDQTQRLAFLRQMHEHLNREAFLGALGEIPIDIDDIAERYGDAEALAVYCSKAYGEDAPKITFGTEFVAALARIPDEQKQLEQLLTVMLHEMVHQYCDENELDAFGHDETFRLIADLYGLLEVYEDDEPRLHELSDRELLRFRYQETL